MTPAGMVQDRKLSQREIEALIDRFFTHERLNTPAATPAPWAARGKSVKVYDFRRPDKFSKDHLRALRIINGSFARLLSSSLTTYLRTAVQVKPAAVEQAVGEGWHAPAHRLARGMDERGSPPAHDSRAGAHPGVRARDAARRDNGGDAF